MRILFLTSTLPRFAGDMQPNFVGDQAAAWKAARPDDEIHILAPHHASSELRESWDGVEITRFRYIRPAKLQTLAYPAILPNIRRKPWLAVQIPPFLWSQYRTAARIVREREIDLIYAHWVMPQGLVAFALSKRFGVPFVLQNHSSDVRVFGKLGDAGNALARRIIRAARHLFCVNSAQRDYALGLFDGAEFARISAKTSVLPMGVVPPQRPGRASARYEFGAIARLSKKKGLHHFIGAAEALASQGFRPPIAIAGGGEDAEELQSAVKQADIHFAGYLSGADKDRFFDQVRIFVMPSTATGGDVEGMPVALLEALCRGKPTIASHDTNIASLPEWSLIARDVFYLDDPADVATLAAAMKSAAASAGDFASRSKRLKAAMARYWWPNLVREYLDALGLSAEKAA